MTDHVSRGGGHLGPGRLARLAVAFLSACAATDRAATDAATAGAAPLPTTDPQAENDGPACPRPRGEVLLDLAVARLPWDSAPPPTDMNGFILDVADAGVLADPSHHTWWESPADLPLTCPDPGGPPAPCRAALGPFDISHVVAAGRPLLLRARPTSEQSPWETLLTVLPTGEVGDGNTLSGTVYVASAWAPNDVIYQLGLIAAEGGILGLMTDANGQLPAGARLALADRSLVGEAPATVVAEGLRTPGWGTVDMAYLLPDYSWQALWTEHLVSAAVFASTPRVTTQPALPAAWMGIRDGEAPLVSDIVPVDLVAGNLVVLPLTLRPTAPPPPPPAGT